MDNPACLNCDDSVFEQGLFICFVITMCIIAGLTLALYVSGKVYRNVSNSRAKRAADDLLSDRRASLQRARLRAVGPHDNYDPDPIADAHIESFVAAQPAAGYGIPKPLRDYLRNRGLNGQGGDLDVANEWSRYGHVHQDFTQPGIHNPHEPPEV
jgi:hypothetical protein